MTDVIIGTDSPDYTPIAADLGTNIYCKVTAINAAGSANASSNTVGEVATAAPGSPASTVAPVVSGSTTQNSTLTSTTGAWTGTTPITYAYQWFRAPNTPISGATSSTYALVSGDVGASIYCRVTATNVVSSTNATSNTVGPVTVAGPSFPALVNGQAYADQHRGVFLTYNMSTYCGVEFAPPQQDRNTFNPTGLDVSQWLDVVEEFGAKYAVLTVKHADGFCLWPTTTTLHNIANTTWYATHGQPDITQMFVDECLARSIRPVLYFSIDDRNWYGMNPGYTAATFAAFQEGQMQELFTRYHPAAVWLDSTYWYMGSWYPWATSAERNAIIKGLQPGIIVVDNNHTATLADSDVVEYESGLVPAPNTDPCESCVSVSGPSAWFWKSDTMPLIDAGSLGDGILHLNNNNGTYLLNFPPNMVGIISEQQVARMRQIKMYLGEVPRISPDNMISNSSPGPYVVSASSEYPGADAYKAFNSSLPYPSFWGSTGGVLPDWIQIDLGIPATVGTYMVQARQGGVYHQWLSWTLAGSPDGTTWTTVQTVNETAYVNPGTTRFYDLAPPQTYRYWRWTITHTVTDTDSDVEALALFGPVGSVQNTPPVNTGPPTITGATFAGAMLSSTTGAWTGSPTPTYTYQWVRVTSTGDVAPVNTVAPVVTGVVQQGQTLTTTNGTWTGTPAPTFTYQWFQAPSLQIVGASASTYTLVSGDVGNNIYCRITAINTAGTGFINSNQVGPVASLMLAPANTVAPVVSGTPAVGQALSTTNGTWDGSPTPTYTYQWVRVT